MSKKAVTEVTLASLRKRSNGLVMSVKLNKEKRGMIKNRERKFEEEVVKAILDEGLLKDTPWVLTHWGDAAPVFRRRLVQGRLWKILKAARLLDTDLCLIEKGFPRLYLKAGNGQACLRLDRNVNRGVEKNTVENRITILGLLRKLKLTAVIDRWDKKKVKDDLKTLQIWNRKVARMKTVEDIKRT